MDVVAKPPVRYLQTVIFGSRWLQAPLYVGLILAQLVYAALFLKELWEMIVQFPGLGEKDIMLIVLGLIDVVLISNLLMMVIIGGWETFVSRLRLHDHPDQPEWLSHINANVLKVKLAMAIVGISSIHLLHTFIDADGIGSEHSVVTAQGAMWQTVIHVVFVASAIGVAFVDRIGHPAPHH